MKKKNHSGTHTFISTVTFLSISRLHGYSVTWNLQQLLVNVVLTCAIKSYRDKGKKVHELFKLSS